MAKKAKKAVKKVKPTLKEGSTGFIVMSYQDWTKTYQLNACDIHSSLEEAEACCGEDGDAVLEVTVQGIHKNVTTYVKQDDLTGLKFAS